MPRVGDAPRTGEALIKNRAYTAKWKKENPERHRLNCQKYKKRHALRVTAAFRFRTYGLTLEATEAMLKAQEGRCALCFEPFVENKFCVDHDHVTKKVRALLHRACNTMLGQGGDSSWRLQQGIEYLKKFGG